MVLREGALMGYFLVLMLIIHLLNFFSLIQSFNNSSKFQFPNLISYFRNSDFHTNLFNNYYHHFIIYLFNFKIQYLNNSSKFRFLNLILISEIPRFISIYLIIITLLIYLSIYFLKFNI